MILLVVARIICPLAAIAAIIVGFFAWKMGQYGLAAIDTCLAAVNLVLSYINWWWLK
jgi:hypothetical protein